MKGSNFRGALLVVVGCAQAPVRYAVPVPAGLTGSIGDFALLRSRLDSSATVGVWGTYADMSDSAVRIQVRAVRVTGPGRSMLRMWQDALSRMSNPGGREPLPILPPHDTVWAVPMPIEVRIGRVEAASSGPVLVAVALVQEDVLQFAAPVTWGSEKGDARILAFAKRFVEYHISARQQLRQPGPDRGDDHVRQPLAGDRHFRIGGPGTAPSAPDRSGGAGPWCG